MIFFLVSTPLKDGERQTSIKVAKSHVTLKVDMRSSEVCTSGYSSFEIMPIFSETVCIRSANNVLKSNLSVLHQQLSDISVINPEKVEAEVNRF